ncbi:zonular occludens toxin domain-containing protein [Aliivibrio fischeri]|uniref:zonular occludens toxin domain-containing protein n=2 Tax=Aliivibrio fischeri TaxID=668 RepID=UPI0007C4C3EF|nr:zonular occludens toxin domain-containing protein [Aliivibrio fischeri]MBP3140305.1 toxin [Aliivibrio fischeri]MBP3140314.1 toxin [Aliivibrio fischeri]MBP3154691.1 toxin [Aliivibrio fischeri]
MITIRTGGNGSYKSAYVAYFTILPALKAGRVVVTNFEGMEPLEVIEERLEIKFPSSAKLIRIFSRDSEGVKLWQHFFCWCPLNSLIVIDECQDLFSKNVGFKMDKIKAAPLADFIDLLPKDYENFFNSRHVPVNLDELKPSEIDDRGKAEYDDQGRIIYPLSFNEGFMRHRKYNWDIELISPDWKQIDSSIKACAEQAFFHKNRDGFIGAKRKPYIYKHSTEDSKITLPKKKDPNLLTQKIPLEAHLIYKSTGTGAITHSGGMNVLLKNPMVWFYFLLAFFSVAYVIYGITSQVDNDSPEVQEVTVEKQDTSTVSESGSKTVKSTKNSNDLPSDRNSDTDFGKINIAYVPVNQVLYFDGILDAYLTSIHYKVLNRSKIETSLLLNVNTIKGVYSINENYLEAVGVTYKIIDECLIELSNGALKSMVTCGALGTTLSGSNDNSDDLGIKQSLPAAASVSDLVKENSIFL